MKKINNAPINVKMCQIPHYIGFNNKPKASIITSSYFNINLKNKANLILNKRKVNNNNTNKNERNKTNKELKSNYYSLIIANNRNKHLPNKNSVNFSKLSINSLITNSINKSKKIINNRRKNIINEEEYSIISKKKNYSFKIKVNKIKEKLNLGNSRNSSLKKCCHSNDNVHNKQKTIISTESLLNNKSDLRSKSRNKEKKTKNERKNFSKNYSVKSVFFKKVGLRNELNYINKKNNIYLSYSDKEKNKKKIKAKIINDSSNLIKNISNINLVSNKYKNIKDNNIFKIHTRNNTTSCNSKIINNLFNNKKIKGKIKREDSTLNTFSSISKKNLNKTNILNNLNIEHIKLKNKLVISPRIKFGTNIIKGNNIDMDNFLNKKSYNSISENINNLKNILSRNNNNNYNTHDNIDNNKKKIIKDIPLPKLNKNYYRASKENKKNINYIKDIKIKKIKKNKIKKEIRSNVKPNKNKIIHKEKEDNIINKNNYDIDDFENEKIIGDYPKNKISIIDILRQDKNKSIGKKIKSIKIENNKSKNKKFKQYIYNCTSNSNNNKTNYEMKLSTKIIKKIIQKKSEEIIKNNIENNLFDTKNIINLDNSDVDDKFDDLYSIIKRFDFDSISIDDNGIFDNENKDYKNYVTIFNNYYNKKTKNIKSIFISKEKKNSKNLTESTKMNSTSSKKPSFLYSNNNKNYIREFLLDK